MNHDSPLDAQPVVTRLADFDPASGSVIERAFFNHRPWVLLLGLLLTLVLGWQVSQLRLSASFFTDLFHGMNTFRPSPPRSFPTFVRCFLPSSCFSICPP